MVSPWFPHGFPMVSMVSSTVSSATRRLKPQQFERAPGRCRGVGALGGTHCQHAGRWLGFSEIHRRI